MRQKLLTALALALALSAAATAQEEPTPIGVTPPAPTPTATNAPAPDLAARAAAPPPARPVAVGATAAVNAWVRASPEFPQGERLRVVPLGTRVGVLAQLPDREWYEVRLADGLEGWMHYSVLQLQVGASQPAEAPPPPPAAPAGYVNGVTVTRLPAAALQQATATPDTAITLVLRACTDRNKNGACDVDEGASGLTVYVTDPVSGAVRGQNITDSAGVAQVATRIAADGSLVVSVPYFVNMPPQTVTLEDRALRPLVLPPVARMPGLLP